MKPIGKEIRIKTETNIAKDLVIKQEIKPKNAEQHSYLNRNQVPMDPDSIQEKQKLIEAFVAMKSENQKLTFNLNKKSEDCIKLAAEKLDLEQKLVTANAKITQLESDLLHFKGEYAEKMNEYKQKLSDSNQQKRKLNACYNQLQSSMSQKDQIANKSDNIYEVEKIIDEKKIGKAQYYRVRWEGFNEKDDTWERETNLFCPDILEEYLKTKKTN